VSASAFQRTCVKVLATWAIVLLALYAFQQYFS
jgi:hypothetical protein